MAKAPTTEVDLRERKAGCLKCATHSWYSFIKLLETLYIVNTNAVHALQHQGKLLENITAATRRSETLRERFRQCFPPHFGEKEKKSMFRAYNILLLPCYGKMKSGDTLRLLRNSSAPRGGASRLPTRVRAAAAHESAKTKLQ